MIENRKYTFTGIGFKFLIYLFMAYVSCKSDTRVHGQLSAIRLLYYNIIETVYGSLRSQEKCFRLASGLG